LSMIIIINSPKSNKIRVYYIMLTMLETLALK